MQCTGTMDLRAICHAEVDGLLIGDQRVDAYVTQGDGIQYPAIIDGRPAARHGDKTACGATLIASQSLTTD